MFITNKHNVNGQPGEIDMLVYQLNQLQNFPSVCCSTTEHTEYTEKTRVSQLCDSVCPVYSEVLKLPQLYGLTDEEIAIVGGTNDGKSGDAAKTDDGEGAAATQGGGGRDGARPKRRSGRRSLRRSSDAIHCNWQTYDETGCFERANPRCTILPVSTHRPNISL